MKNFDKNFYKDPDSLLSKLKVSESDYEIIHKVIGKIKEALQKGLWEIA